MIHCSTEVPGFPVAHCSLNCLTSSSQAGCCVVAGWLSLVAVFRRACSHESSDHWSCAGGSATADSILIGHAGLASLIIPVAAALAKLGVHYAVVGESAVAAWVSRVDESAVRNTRDVDILLRSEDAEKAREALEAAGFLHRRVAQGQ